MNLLNFFFQCHLNLEEFCMEFLVTTVYTHSRNNLIANNSVEFVYDFFFKVIFLE